MIAHGLITKWMTAIATIVVVGLISIGSLTAQSKLAEDTHAERKGIGILPLDEVEDIGERSKPTADTLLPPLEIAVDRSLFIHEKALLAPLTFAAVMDRLAQSSGTVNGGELFRQWVYTLAAGTDAEVTSGLACSSPAHPETVNVNGFGIVCDTVLPMLAEPWLAFDGENGAAAHFTIIGAVNRGDLMPPAGPVTPNCGEYRLIAAADPEWAKAATQSTTDVRILFNFETVVPGDGDFCVAIQKLWASFSVLSDAEVGAALNRFFLLGGDLTSDGVLLDCGSGGTGAFRLKPAIDAENLGGDPSHPRGQVRTNTLTKQIWTWREFEFRDVAGALRLIVTPLDGSADPTLFAGDADQSDDLVAALNSSPTLFDLNINRFSFLPQNSGMEAAQMLVDLSQGAEDARSYKEIADPEDPPEGPIQPGDNPVRDAIVGLAAAQSMTLNQVIRRIEVLSCAGCHRHVQSAVPFVDDMNTPIKWAGPEDFTHIDERTGDIYELSPTLKCIMLPHRELVMRAFLGSPPDPVETPLPESCAFVYQVN